MFRLSKRLLEKFDVVIVGGGPGGYVCAIKAAQLGLKTACIEGRGALGGTCLNVGCIPSKSLLHISHQYHEAKHDFQKKGIKITGVEADVGTMMKQKQKAIRGLTKGIAGLFKANGVTSYDGWGKVKDKNTVILTDGKGVQHTVEADNIVMAVGSKVAGLPGFPLELIDEKHIISSTGALALESVPKSLTVVGGGVIGLELGCVWARLGAKVHVVEFLGKIMGPADKEVSAAFLKILQKQGLTFDLNSKVTGCEKVAGGVQLTWEPVAGGPKVVTVSEKVLIATGRSPNTRDCGIESVGTTLDKMGRITVDGSLRVLDGGSKPIPGVFAIGDAVTGPMLAHKAEEDGVYVAEMIASKAGTKAPISYHGVPSVVYTHPEVAWVGLSEEELVAKGIPYQKASFPMMANSRARANDDADGFVKILASTDTDPGKRRILGCHMICVNAGDVLMPAVGSVQHNRPLEDLAHTCFAHPTVSEALKEAVLASVYGKAIHNL